MESLRWNSPASTLGSWLDRRNVLAYQVPLRLARLLDARDGANGEAPPGALPGENLLQTPTNDPDELRSMLPWLDQPLLEPGQFSADEFHRIEASRALRIREGDRHGAYTQLFRALAAMASAAGDIPFAVMLIPDQFQVDDDLWATVTSQLGVEGLDREQPQARIRDWLRDNGVPVLDLLPIFRASPPLPDSNRHLYHLRDTHWNARGNQVAGEALARFLGELRQ
jgi:hypothetical protein